MAAGERGWNRATLDELKRGYQWDGAAGEFRCLACGAGFRRGQVFPVGEAWLEAETAAREHFESTHGAPFEWLLRQDKKFTGLTPLQREVLARHYAGESDPAAAIALGAGSASTVRNHRFALREREKQARVFLAIMELLTEQRADDKAAPARRRVEAAGPLATVPRRQKKREALLEAAGGALEPGRQYREAEINELLGAFCADFAALRRALVGSGVLQREPDGSRYWLAEIELMENGKMDRKALKQQYLQMRRPMGVFQLRNQVNGRILVESSLNLDARRHRFEYEVEHGSVSHNKALQEDWARDGGSNFVFEILEQLKPHDDPQHDYRFELAELEKAWLEKLQPYGERGYNRLPAAARG